VSRCLVYLPSILWTNPWSLPLTVTCTPKYPGAGAWSASIYRYSIHASCWGRWGDDTSKVNAVRIQPISERAGRSSIKTFPNWVEMNLELFLSVISNEGVKWKLEVCSFFQYSCVFPQTKYGGSMKFVMGSKLNFLRKISVWCILIPWNPNYNKQRNKTWRNIKDLKSRSYRIWTLFYFHRAFFEYR
jgi:hypothetical protein